jgi:alkylhydroperoxidase/carboxymuconolactone decarboxylase family protein YurZ
MRKQHDTKNEKNKTRVLIAFVISLMSLASSMNAQTSMNKNQILNAKEQSIVIISALTARGDLENLRRALNGGLDSGLTVNEIKELLVKCIPTAAFRAV